MSDIVVEMPADGVAVVTINRPNRLNALEPLTIPALVVAFESLAADPAVRAVVLTGAGQGFCAGVDLASRDQWPNPTFDATRAFMQRVHQGVLALTRLPQPVIAAVNGAAAGGGFGLALACDVRVAARSAVFVASFPKLGLGPDTGISHTLPRVVGNAKALELLLTCEPVDAEHALALGLVTTVVDDAVHESIALAEKFAQLPGHVSRRIKATLLRAATVDLPTTLLEVEADAQAELFSDPAMMTLASSIIARHT